MLLQRTSTFAPFALASLSVAALLSLSSVASAKGKLGIDVEAALPTDEASGVDTGWGAALRFGHQYDLPLIYLTPEFAGRYTQFGGSADLTAWSLMAGGRLGISFILSPSVFAHAGLGHFGFNGPPNADSSQTALGYDFGAALDLTVLPIIDIGAHVTWNGIAGDSSIDPLNWVAVGGHLQFTIPGL